MNEIEILKLHPHPWEDEIFKGDEDRSDFENLKQDISERGLKTPILITGSDKVGSLKPHTIIAGHRRVRACKELGHRKIACIALELKTENEINEQFLKDNALRRKFSKVERVFIYQKLLQVEQGKASERLKLSDGRGKKGVEKSPHLNEEFGKSRDLAAKALGVSGRTMEDELKAYLFLTDKDDYDEDIFNEWKEGKKSTQEVLELMRFINEAKRQPERKQDTLPLKKEAARKLEEAKPKKEPAKPIEDSQLFQPSDLVAESLEHTIEILQKKEYGLKHLELLQTINALCAEAIKEFK